MNYETIPSVVYTHLEVAWVGKTEQYSKWDRVGYKLAGSHSLPIPGPRRLWTLKAKSKFSVEETDRVLGVHIIGASSKLPFDGRVIKSPGLILSYLRS